MLTETARVVSVEHDGVWVEARRKSHCRNCAANSSCGHRLLGKLHAGRANRIKVDTSATEPLDGIMPGAMVSIGIPDALILKISFLFYLLPLAGLIGASLLADYFLASELLTITSGLAGLALGFYLVGRAKLFHQVPGGSRVRMPAVLLDLQVDSPRQDQDRHTAVTIIQSELK